MGKNCLKWVALVAKNQNQNKQNHQNKKDTELQK